MPSPSEQVANLKRAFAENDIPFPGEPRSLTIFWAPEGPLMKYSDGFLQIEDLNPELKTKWRLTRAELLHIGWRFLRAAMMR